MRRQREQLAVARDIAAVLQGEQDAARGGARQTGGSRDFAQRHRRSAIAKRLQQPQTAVEALDKVGGAGGAAGVTLGFDHDCRLPS